MAYPHINEAAPATRTLIPALPSDPVELQTSKALVQNPTSDVLGTDSLDLHLSSEQMMGMSRSIVSIFELDEEPLDEDVEMVGEDEEDAEVDLADQQRRTDRLKGVLPVLAQLWWSASEQIDVVAEKLADGSRDPKWRIPLGESGVLNFFLEIFSGHELRHALKIHVLRLIGNACADTDENRARLVISNHLPSFILQLRDPTCIAFAIPVLFNICVDYEPAQKQASEYSLTKELIQLVSSPKFDESRAFLGYICKILDLMVAQTSDIDLAPDNAPIVLLKIAADRESPVDMDDFIALVNTALCYLQHEKFQLALVAQGALDDTLAVLVDSYTRFDSHPSIPTNGPISPDQEDAKALSQMRTSFNLVLSDISALPEFKDAYPVTSPFTSSLRRWLSSPQLQLKICACIMLGNLARSDETCEEFVHVAQVHHPLIAILAEANDSQLLHATLGFLKNLAMPAKNKEPLADASLFEYLPRLWAMDTLQPIQLSSISLARQLTIGCYPNIKRICRRLSEDEDSPSYNRTKLSLVISLFERTDVEPIKMEIARLVTSICRVYESGTGRSNAARDETRIRGNFFKIHPDIGRPLGFMVSQTKWPVVRSEGWFVFALIARTPDGAECISDLLHDVVIFRPLVEMLTGKRFVDFQPSSSVTPSSSSPSDGTASSASLSPPGLTLEAHSPASGGADSQAAQMARGDRENALSLVHGLLKNRGDEMAVMRRTMLEDLLKGGGELVGTYQESSPSWRGENTVPVPLENRHRAGLNLQELAQQSFQEL